LWEFDGYSGGADAASLKVEKTLRFYGGSEKEISGVMLYCNANMCEGVDILNDPMRTPSEYRKNKERGAMQGAHRTTRWALREWATGLFLPLKIKTTAGCSAVIKLEKEHGFQSEKRVSTYRWYGCTSYSNSSNDSNCTINKSPPLNVEW